MIHVAVDTTSLFADPTLRSAQWRQLLSAAESGRAVLCVPEIVLREAQRHFAKIVRKAGKNLTDGYGALRQHDVSLPDAPAYDIRNELEAEIARYDARVRDRLARAGATVLPLPQVPLERVLDRDLDERKPFDDKGKGFRDTLIWLSVVEHVRALPPGDTLVLVTDNSADFGKDRPFDDLLEDLASAGVDADAVVLVTDLPACLAMLPAEPPEPEREVAVDDEESLSDGVASAIKGLCATLVGADVATYYDSSGIPFEDDTIPSVLDGPTIYDIEPNLASVDLQVIEEYQGTTVLVEATVDAVVALDGFIYKADYYATEPEVDVFDADWNDHMMWVHLDRNAELRFSARVELPADVQDIELVAIAARR